MKAIVYIGPKHWTRDGIRERAINYRAPGGALRDPLRNHCRERRQNDGVQVCVDALVA